MANAIQRSLEERFIAGKEEGGQCEGEEAGHDAGAIDEERPVGAEGPAGAGHPCHRGQTDLEVAMEAYARWLENQREDARVPPEGEA